MGSPRRSRSMTKKGATGEEDLTAGLPLTKDVMEQILKQQQQIFEKCMSTFQTQQENFLKTIIAEIKTSSETQIHALQSEVFQIAQENEKLKTENSGLKRRVSEQGDLIAELIERQDDMEAYTRRECLVIQGLNERENDMNERREFQSFAETALEVQVNDTDISRLHRLGAPRSDGKPRPMVVKFVRHDKKSEIYRGKKKLKNTRYFISELLSARSKRIFEKAKALQQNNMVHSIWTVDGTVFCKRSPEGRPIVMKTEKDLEKITA